MSKDLLEMALNLSEVPILRNMDGSKWSVSFKLCVSYQPHIGSKARGTPDDLDLIYARSQWLSAQAFNETPTNCRLDARLRQRSSEGRFTFKVRNNRKFWRLYLVDGKDCVCNDSCGNDFCYIDVERAVLTDAGANP